jgi:TonB family protein
LIAAEGARRKAVRALQDLPDLSKNERDALGALPDATPIAAMSLWRTSAAPARTVMLPVEGVVRETVDAAGCKTNSVFAGATLAYWPDGRPKRIDVNSSGMSPECAKALSVLARLSIAEPGYPVTSATQAVVLPMHPTFLECTSRAHGPRPGPRDARAITPPKKIRDARPVFPESAMRRGIQGVVVISARISAAGCIDQATIVRSVPELDVPALWAVTQWLYEAARLDGKPVDIDMTLTVNFKLG